MFAYLTVIPVLLIILLIRGYPLVNTVAYSFTDWNGIKQSSYIGLLNYTNLLSGDQFWLLLRNTFFYLLYIPLQIIIGMIFAIFVFEKMLFYKTFRIVFYLPQVISMVVIGYLFANLFAYDGPVNNVLEMIGLPSLVLDWFGSATTAIPIIIFCLVWMNIGWQGLIFAGGFSNIDSSIFDAATIDGASFFQRMFKIIIPMLGRSIEYSVIVCVIWVFSALFPIIFTMTNGGPAYKTTTIDFMIYNLAFRQGRIGSACALAVILTIFMVIITRIEFHISDKANSWQ